MGRNDRRRRKKATGDEPSTEAIRGAEAPQGADQKGRADRAEAVHSAENAGREAAPEGCRRSANPSIARCKCPGYRSVFTTKPK